MTRNKAQEEMVGFVLIIVLIMIISLVFLGFSLRQKSKPQMDSEVENLLSAMVSYTTSCALYMPEYETLEDLIKSCYNTDKCSDGRDTCQELREVLIEMLQATQGDLSTGDKPVKAYEMNVSYASKPLGSGFISRRPESTLAYVRSGSCNATSVGAQRFIDINEGNIVLSLKFCY